MIIGFLATIMIFGTCAMIILISLNCEGENFEKMIKDIQFI